jgi:TolB-like protein/DNA-binding SARP family transcriptional activator/Flp pilus assembly protein TadD
VFVLRLFGGACIEGDGSPLTGPVAQRRRLALLALLAASPDGRLAREKLCAHLWPESGEAESRASLADAVYVLRRHLGKAALLSVGDELRLNPERIGSDLQRFRAAVAAGDFEQAVELYAGPFLDGFFVHGAAEFERWAEAERQRCVDDYGLALEALASRREAAGHAAAALAVWRRLSQHDPYSSRVALALMRALAAAGAREAAIQHGLAFRRLLHDEIGADPDPAVLEFCDRLRSVPHDSPGAQASDPSTAAATPGAAARAGATAGAPAPPAAATLGAPATSAALAGPAASDPAAEGASPARPPRRRRRVLAAPLVLLLAVGIAFAAHGPTVPEPPERSLAVLPFADLSPDGAHAWFADGLTDELIGELARVEGLRVAARTSVYAFRGRHVPLRELGRQLQVRYVLEGSARRQRDRVRITAQLFDTRSGYPLWATTLERDLDDLLTVQRELAAGIARSLELELELGGTAADPGTQDPQAYDDYLQGRYHWMHGSVTDASTQEQAIHFFGQAVQRDPRFARAHAGLADAYSHAGRPEDALETARRAVALDSMLAEARTALAYPLAFHEWRWRDAERELARAIELDPHTVLPYLRRANVLAALGRTDEAIADVERAARMEPLSFLVSYNRGLVYYWVGRYDEAVRFLGHTLALDTARTDVRRELADAHFGRGDMEQAAALYRSAGDTIFALLATGSRSRLEALAAAAASTPGLMTPAARAKLHARLGRHDDALRDLQAAVDAPDRWIPFHLSFPAFAPLRDDPRFRRLRQQVGLLAEPAVPHDLPPCRW